MCYTATVKQLKESETIGTEPDYTGEAVIDAQAAFQQFAKSIASSAKERRGAPVLLSQAAHDAVVDHYGSPDALAAEARRYGCDGVHTPAPMCGPAVQFIVNAC